jgi:vacuolar-type H+-ATPase subunit E/Vma4
MLEDEIRKIADDMRKEAEDWVKNVDEQSDKVVKFIRENTKELSAAIEKERKKMELRSEIGEHTRALTKAYTRLGEAYYDSIAQRRSIGDVNDLLSLINSNKKLVDLLQSQLDELEGPKEQ